MNFSYALDHLKEGKRIARKGWNGKGLWVKIAKIHTHTPVSIGDVNSVLEPFIVIKNIENKFNTWVPSISDLLANDWIVVEEEKKELDEPLFYVRVDFNGEVRNFEVSVSQLEKFCKEIPENEFLYLGQNVLSSKLIHLFD